MQEASSVDDIHWVDNIIRTCEECLSKKRHDRGVRTKEGGKKVTVVECLHCHTITEVAR